MNFVKKFAKFIGWIAAHILEAITTGVTAIAALASLYLADSMAMKLFYFIGFLASGFVISIFLAKLRGEDKEQ